MIHTLTSNRLQTLILAIACCFISNSAQAQLGVAFYQSNIPFIGVNYEINDRLRPELSVGVDQSLQSISLMLDVNYDFINKEKHEVYAGLGFLIFDEFDEGLTIQVGVNMYPFETRQFGFHIEAMPTIFEEGAVIFGSWGIRYQFGKAE